MRRVVSAAVVLAAVLAVASASAKTVTIAITRAGFVPKTAALVTGDSVAFVNHDTQAHQVVLKPATGFTCTAGLTIQPGQSTSCTFRTAGSYAVTDASNKGNAWKATITVTASSGGALTLQASPSSVVYGGKATLTGTLATGQANAKVSILARVCGTTAFRQISTVATATGGAFTYAVQPAKNTTYQAKEKSTTSSQVPSVTVRPRIALRRLAPKRFSVKVLAADSFAGKYVVFQRYNASTARWVLVKRVFLKTGATATLPIDPTTTSTATFRARVKARLRVRAVLPAGQTGGCYAASTSNVVRS